MGDDDATLHCRESPLLCGIWCGFFERVLHRKHVAIVYLITENPRRRLIPMQIM